MDKKVCCTCEVVVLLIKPIVFLTFSLSSASLDLKVPDTKIDGLLIECRLALFCEILAKFLFMESKI